MTWILPLVSTFVLAQNVGLAIASIPYGDCRDSMISVSWRESVLKIHNDGRRKIAGRLMKFPNGTFWPQANNMSELFWNCNLEKKALKGAKACTDFVAEEKDKKYGFLQEIYETSNECDITADAERILGEWWNQSVQQTDIKYNDKTAPNFGLMAYHKVAEMACTHKTCKDNGKATLLCLYNEKAPEKDTPLYGGNETCTETSCGSVCVKYLCQKRVPVPDGSNCGDSMSDDLQNAVINMHNYYRRILATGWAENSKGGYAPRAEAMQQLKYNCEMSLAIERAIQTCPDKAPLSPAGQAQNYRLIEKIDFTRRAVEETITMWWDEYKNNGPIEGNKLTSNVKKNMGNFANMVHDKVTEFACGINACDPSGTTVVVCRYNQVIKDDIYVEGRPCKNCGCSELGGLCVS